MLSVECCGVQLFSKMWDFLPCVLSVDFGLLLLGAGVGVGLPGFCAAFVSIISFRFWKRKGDLRAACLRFSKISLFTLVLLPFHTLWFLSGRHLS